MGAFVYILHCSDGSFYVGTATGDDLSKRIAEHDSGAYPGYTLAVVLFGWFGHSTLIGSRMPLLPNGN